MNNNIKYLNPQKTHDRRWGRLHQTGTLACRPA